MEREQTTLRLPVELLDALRKEAEARGIGLNQLVSQIFRKVFLSGRF
jgi:predicted HicB family RNase H-like nuclease